MWMLFWFTKKCSRRQCYLRSAGRARAVIVIASGSDRRRAKLLLEPAELLQKYGKRCTICVNRELIGARMRDITSKRAHVSLSPKPKVEKFPIHVAAKRLEIDENVNRTYLRVHWVAVVWCNEQSYSYSQSQNEWMQIEHIMCGRRAVWSALWCLPCFYSPMGVLIRVTLNTCLHNVCLL